MFGSRNARNGTKGAKGFREFRGLSRLSRSRVRETEAEIDRLAAELWGLSQKELEVIQRSLEELM